MRERESFKEIMVANNMGKIFFLLKIVAVSASWENRKIHPYKKPVVFVEEYMRN